jgi:hypothetical protein
VCCFLRYHTNMWTQPFCDQRGLVNLAHASEDEHYRLSLVREPKELAVSVLETCEITLADVSRAQLLDENADVCVDKLLALDLATLEAEVAIREQVGGLLYAMVRVGLLFCRASGTGVSPRGRTRWEARCRTEDVGRSAPCHSVEARGELGGHAWLQVQPSLMISWLPTGEETGDAAE